MEANSVPFERGSLGLMAQDIRRLEAVKRFASFGLIQLVMDNMTDFGSGFAQILSYKRFVTRHAAGPQPQQAKQNKRFRCAVGSN